LKVLKALFCIIKTFNLVPKVVGTDFGTRSKVFKAKNTIIRTFDQVPKSVPTTFVTTSNALLKLLIYCQDFWH
jgi:hypothetical protein